MYQINTNSLNFTERTKTVFDTLFNIESDHKSKLLEYSKSNEENKTEEEEENEEQIDEPNIRINEIKLNDSKEPVFKVPLPIKRRNIHAIQIESKKITKPADHVINPHKWKKYSLKDVKESQMSPSANYAAAMSFLNSKIQDNMETNEEESIIYNKPIGNKKFGNEELNETADFDKLDSSDPKEKVEIEKIHHFKKKSNRKNLRTIKSDENEDFLSCSVSLTSIKASKTEKLIKNFTKIESMDDEDSELTLSNVEDIDVNESNQYDLFD
jgi:hypothetical protein